MSRTSSSSDPQRSTSPSFKNWSTSTAPGARTPSHAACIARFRYSGKSPWCIRTFAPVACWSFWMPPTWSMWACVATMYFAFRLCRARISLTCSMSSPGSITTASPVASSPTIEQLHWSIPTGMISWIIRFWILDFRFQISDSRFQIFDCRFAARPRCTLIPPFYFVYSPRRRRRRQRDLYQIWQRPDRTIGSPGLHENASANAGMLDGAAMARKRSSG